MATFGKNERDNSYATGGGTVIGSNVKLVGALRDNNDLVIHGTIEGEVTSEQSVTIGETAQISGPVSGTVVNIAGLVKGTVDASQRLEIQSTGKIYGDIVVADLAIHSGATFVGKCTMEGGVRAEEPPAPLEEKAAEYENN